MYATRALKAAPVCHLVCVTHMVISQHPMVGQQRLPQLMDALHAACVLSAQTNAACQLQLHTTHEQALLCEVPCVV